MIHFKGWGTILHLTGEGWGWGHPPTFRGWGGGGGGGGLFTSSVPFYFCRTLVMVVGGI